MSTQRTVVLMPMDKMPICKILNQKLQLTLTPENITNPTAEIAQQVYLHFVRLILNVSENCLSTLPLSANCDYDPELHRRSIPIIIVFQCMKAFIKDNSGDKLDLTMCDLVHPQRVQGRFKKLTTFLADYIKFHENGQRVFNEISEEFSSQKQEVEQLQQAIEDQERRKNELLSQQNLRKRREHELINEHNKVNSEFNGIVGQYEANRSSAEDLLKQKEEAVKRIEQVETEIIRNRKTAEHLKEELLSSPEELRSEMAAGKKQIEELKECLKASKAALAEKMEAIDICMNVEKNIPIVNEKLRSWTTVREEIVVLSDAVNEDHRKLADLEDELKFATEKKKNVHKLMGEQAESHAQIQNEHLQRNEELNRNIEAITKQIAALKENQPDVSKGIEKKRQELIDVKNSNSSSAARVAEECRETLANYQNVLTLYEEVHRNANEKQVAVDRATSRVLNSCLGRLPTDYTFSTSSCCTEDGENVAPDTPIGADFNVFK